MLQFLLIFHLNNVFSKCDEIDAAKFNESILLAQHYQNLRQVNAVLKDVQQKIHNISLVREDDEKHGRRFDNINKPDKYQIHQNGNALMKESAKFHPSANYDPLPTNSDRRQGRWIPPYSSGLGVLQSPLVIPRPKPGYRMAVVPFNPGEGRGPAGYLLRPVRSRIQPNPRLLQDFHFQNLYLRPPGLNMPLFTPRPALQGFSQPLDTELNSIQESPQLLSPLLPSFSPAVSNPAGLGTFQPHSTLFSSIRPTTREGVKIWMESLYSIYVPIFDKWKYVSKDQSPSATESTSKINDDQAVTGAADDVQLFIEDGHGFLYLNRPEKGGTVPVPQYSKHEDATTAGEIKVQDPPLSPMHRYQVLMERLEEGYMMVFMLELCRLIAMKNEKDVQQALHHMETIYNHLWNNGRLAWIDEPLQTVIWKLAVFMSGDDIDVVRTDASMMFHMLLRRKQVLSPEVNSILDEADSFFDEAEGNQLFSALKEFENYPNTTKSSYWLCDNLIEGFMRPFRHGRQYHWKRRQKLMAAINDALKKRFPRLKEHSEGKSKNGKQRKRKRKRHRYPYKMLRKRKKPKAPDYYNEDIHDERQEEPNIDNENSILGTITPPTSYQAEFRAIPTKTYRIMKKSRKELNFLNRPKRIYSFNKRNKRLSYQLRVTTVIQEKHNDVVGRSNDTIKITKKSDHRYHHIIRKTSTAKHRTPEEEDLSNNADLPESSSPLPFKKFQKDKTHIYQMKNRFKKHVKKRDTRSKLRAGLLRKISFFPTMLQFTSPTRLS